MDMPNNDVTDTDLLAAQAAHQARLELRKAYFDELVRQIPDASVRIAGAKGTVLIVIRTPHPDGGHSVVWENPGEEPKRFRIWSHYNVFAPDVKRQQRTYAAVGEPQLLDWLDRIYGRPRQQRVISPKTAEELTTGSGTDWVETAAELRFGTEASPEHVATELMADLVAYCLDSGIDPDVAFVAGKALLDRDEDDAEPSDA
jgi:hypothetical protein